MSNHRMMLLATTLILSSGLVGCVGGSKEGPKEDLSVLRKECMEQSGFTGNAQHFPGGVFLWRSDGEKVAECEWDGTTVKFIGILGHGHPAD